MKKIKIAHIEPDDAEHKKVLELLAPHRRLAVTHHHRSAQQALSWLPHTRPDVVLTEAVLPDMALADLLTTLAGPAFKHHPLFVVYTRCTDHDTFVHALKKLVKGYLLKDFDEQLLIRALSGPGMAEMVLSPVMAAKLLRDPKAYSIPSEKVLGRLTSRQQPVLIGCKTGKLFTQVGNELCVSPSTVKSHSQNINRTLQTNSIMESVQKVYDEPFR